MRTHIATHCVLAVSWLVLATPAIAQTPSRFHLGVVGGSDYHTGDSMTGSIGSAGLTGGIQFLPWLGVDVDVLRPSGMLTREYTGTSISFAGPGASREDVEAMSVVTRYINQRRPRITVSLGVTFQPSHPARRVRPRLFVGLSHHRTFERTVLEHVSLPPGVTLEQVNRTLPPDPGTDRQLGGFTVGGGVAIDVATQLSIAPDVRFDYGSLGDEINNWLRSSLRVLWRF